MEDKYEVLRLKNQLCFPLYSVANKIIRSYTPLLNELDLTYTQYIVMMVLWEKEDINEKELGETLFLKSNTLTPLLKKLIEKGYVSKKRNSDDARNIIISLTKEGLALKDKAVKVPRYVAEKIHLSANEAIYLYKILYKMLEEENEEL